MSVEAFGEVDGTAIEEVTIRSLGGAEARILTWGAVIRDLVVPARQARQRVVLGLNRIEDYVAHSPYFGAVVGRYANRIGEARFTLDGETYHLDVNWGGRHQLHGGSRGFGSRIWSLLDHTPSSATLALVSEDGDMGYPGRLTALCTYAFAEPATLRIMLEAACDRPTPVNLTTHGYFNLDGSPTIADHELRIAGDFITPTTSDLIPTGEIHAVAGTPYDFRTLRPIGPAPSGASYDTNYVLRGGAASLE
jgi:aldose 1-epimerase